MASTMSFAVTPGPTLPSTVMRMFLAGFWISVWVASTCSTSEVPMPNASAPNAPWVEVCESPHTMVMPGWVKPCSGPMMWTMPCRMSSIEKYSMPKSRQLLLQRLDLDAALLLGDALGAVGGGDIVVRHRQGRLRPVHLAAGRAQAFEGLRRGHLMHQVPVDIDQARAVVLLVNQVVVPDLVEQGARFCHDRCRSGPSVPSMPILRRRQPWWCQSFR